MANSFDLLVDVLRSQHGHMESGTGVEVGGRVEGGEGDRNETCIAAIKPGLLAPPIAARSC